MDPKEFLDHINESEKLLKFFREQRKSYLRRFAVAIEKLIFDYFPELKKYQKQFKEPLFKNLETYGINSLECLDHLLSYPEENKKDKLWYRPKPPQTREESEEELKELLLQLPNEDHDSMREIHWEVYEEEQISAQFIYKIHNKMKEIMVDYYIDSILELDGDELRKLNSHLYVMSVAPFVESFYEIRDEILEN